MSPRIQWAIGYLGWDDIQVGGTGFPRAAGGALWHFLSGYLVLGAPIHLVSWGTRALRDELGSVSDGLALDWSDYVTVAADSSFELSYSHPDLHLEKISFTASDPPILRALAGRIDQSPLHICAMRWEAVSAVIDWLASPGRSVTLQLHAETMPSEPEWAVLAGRVSQVFLNEAEFEDMTGCAARRLQHREELAPEFQDVVWVVTAADCCWSIGQGPIVSVQSAAEEEVVDVTGAGDAFAGAYLSISASVPPRAALAYARAIARLTLDGPGTSRLWDLLRQRPAI